MYCFRDIASYLSKVALVCLLVCLLITTVRPIKTVEPIETSCDSGARETTRYMEGRDSQRKRYIILRFSAHWKALDFRLHSTHARGRLPRTSQTTVAFCPTLVVAHCGPTPMIMRKLLVPRTHNKLGDWSFSAAGPRLWNNLPPGLRRPGLRPTFDSFRQSLKTHLFGDRSV